MTSLALFTILLFVITAYFAGRHRSLAVVSGNPSKLHSRPTYHGAYIALWTGIPATLFVLLWLLFQNSFIDGMIVRSLSPATIEGLDAGQVQLIINEIKAIAGGNVFREPTPEIRALAESYNSWTETSRYLMLSLAAIICLSLLLFSLSRIKEAFRARQGVEKILDGIMIACSLIAILTTIGIVVSLVIESMRFFAKVPFHEFLFGINWEPQIPIREDQVAAEGAFGAIPVFTGTLLIAAISLFVAVPIGLFTAIYLSQYASRRFRVIVKPLLEFLAGVPTVVYGFFAVLVVAPALKQWAAQIGLDVAPNSAIAAGSVMGIMLIPFISSLSDDAISAVPQTLTDSSLGLGATKSETILQVLLPAALPGIMGGILLATSRAIGETMIVVMAAGLIATLTLNPFEAVTTVTVQIVTLLIGDSAFDNPKTLSAFALGLFLFIATLALNVLALRITQKYREKYD